MSILIYKPRSPLKATHPQLSTIFHFYWQTMRINNKADIITVVTITFSILAIKNLNDWELRINLHFVFAFPLAILIII